MQQQPQGARGRLPDQWRGPGFPDGQASACSRCDVYYGGEHRGSPEPYIRPNASRFRFARWLLHKLPASPLDRF